MTSGSVNPASELKVVKGTEEGGTSPRNVSGAVVKDAWGAGASKGEMFEKG